MLPASPAARTAALLIRTRLGVLLWRASSSAASAAGGDAHQKKRHLTNPATSSSTLTLEVRPGTGGAEASAFAADLFAMYRGYVTSRPGWSWAEMAALPHGGGGGGGVRLAAALVSGPGAAAALAGEAGVHRVQRVPASESSGRTHTSAATVAILSEEEEVGVAGGVGATAASPTRHTRTRPRDAAVVGGGSGRSSPPLALDPSTVRIDTFRSSGAGGQHVNTTDSAVRAVHLPTGTAVLARGDRSQHKNRAAALAALGARLAGEAVGKAAAARAATRRAQVGSGDRSARVRTYNLARGRVTDHRPGVVVVGDVGGVLSGQRLGELLLDSGEGEGVR